MNVPGHDDRTSVEGGSTGNARVDAALMALDRAARLPLADQVAAYTEVHAVLHETLATIDQG